jgi:thioredoxin-dependent peroxiredoxin
MNERTDLVTFQGNPLTLLGAELSTDDIAPDFIVTANDLSEVSLSSYKGKVCVISAVPSLDTPVCDTQTRKFNEQVAQLDDNVVILTISMDLPFAQARWCAAAGLDNVITLSDHRDASFATAYGLLIKGLRLLARAVYVVDSDGVIKYQQIVPELTDEPDYQAALEAAKQLV